MNKIAFSLICIFISSIFITSLIIAGSEVFDGGVIGGSREEIGEEPRLIELDSLFKGFKDKKVNEKVRITNAKIVKTSDNVKVIFRKGGEMVSRTGVGEVMDPDATRFYEFGNFDPSKEAYVIFNNKGELIEAKFTVEETKFNGKIKPPKDCYFNNRKIPLLEGTEVSFRSGEQSDNLDLIVPDGTILKFSKKSESYPKNLVIKYTPLEGGEFLWEDHYFEKGSLTYNSDQDYLELNEKTLIRHFNLGSFEIAPGNGIRLVSRFEKLNPSFDSFSLKPIKNLDGETISSEIQINSNTGNEIKVKITDGEISFPYFQKGNNLVFQVGGNGQPGSLDILPMSKDNNLREIIAEGEFIVDNGGVSNFVKEGELHWQNSNKIIGFDLKEGESTAYPIKITYAHKKMQVEHLSNGLRQAYGSLTQYQTIN